MKNKFYITTTLPYINAKPHIGFASEIIRADVMARYHKLIGSEVFFNTGTDEHGQKIYEKSKEIEISPEEYSDKLVSEFREIKKLLNLSYDSFIRTTDKKHKKSAQDFWRICNENGYIYKKNYKIKYCVGCEMEKTDSDLNDDGRCPLHPNQELQITEEENYFFKFSDFQERLLNFYKENPNFVEPVKRFNEIKKFVEKGLDDFSISRLKEKMPWGVPVPGDAEHVMYVWFDALTNYISAIGWPKDLDTFKKWWPVVQLCGKDNLRQQTAMWQAMLMAVGIENSKRVYVQGFIISNGQKMSKSLGNVISPNEMVDKYGTDATRYLLLAMGNFGSDVDITWKRLDEKYNADLANGLGNLTSRVIKMSEKLKDQKSPVSFFLQKDGDKKNIWFKYNQFFEDGRIEQVLFDIQKIVSKNNKFIEDNKLWQQDKEDYRLFKKNIKNILSDISLIAELLKPFMPETSEKIQKILETKKTEMLFERVK